MKISKKVPLGGSLKAGMHLLRANLTMVVTILYLRIMDGIMIMKVDVEISKWTTQILISENCNGKSLD